MKVAAARTTEDAEDVRTLARRLGLSTAAGVLAVMGEFYAPDRLAVRSRLLVEELFP